MGVIWGEAGRSPEDLWGRGVIEVPGWDSLGSGGNGEEGYCYRAGGRPGACSYGF